MNNRYTEILLKQQYRDTVFRRRNTRPHGVTCLEVELTLFMEIALPLRDRGRLTHDQIHDLWVHKSSCCMLDGPMRFAWSEEFRDPPSGKQASAAQSRSRSAMQSAPQATHPPRTLGDNNSSTTEGTRTKRVTHDVHNKSC